MRITADEVRCGLDQTVIPNLVYFIIDGQRYEMTARELKQHHMKLTSLLGYFVHEDRFDPPMPVAPKLPAR